MKNISGLLFLFVTLFGCGTHNETENSAPDSSYEASGESFDDRAVPPKEYYDAAFADAVEKMDDENFSLISSTTEVLYLNFSGGTISKGYGPGQSFIP